MNKTESSDNKAFVENIYLFTDNGELLAIVPVHKEDIVNQEFKYLESAPIQGMVILEGDKACWEANSQYSVMNTLDVDDMHVKVNDIVDSTTVNGRQAEAMKRILHDYTDKVVLDRINKASLGYSRFHNGVDYDSLDPEQVIYDGDNAIKAKDLQ